MKTKLIKRSKLVDLAKRTMMGFIKSLEKDYLVDSGMVRMEEISSSLVANCLVKHNFGELPFVLVTQDKIEEFVTYVLHHRWQTLDAIGCFKPEMIAMRKRWGRDGYN